MDDRNRRAVYRARLMAGAALVVGALVACGGGAGGATGVAVQTATPAAATTTASAATTAATTATTASDPAATSDLGGRATALAKNTSTAAARPVAQPANTEGRLLASNCFQCHGTLGTGGFDRIRGKDANEVLEFMTKNASKDIMAAHAQGYTPAQLQKIIAYLQQ